MAITYHIRSRTRPGQWVYRRRYYNEGGYLWTDDGPTTKNADTGLYPGPLPAFYVQTMSHRRSYYNDSNYRATLESQGWLPTRELVHTYLKGSGFSQVQGTYVHGDYPLRKIVLEGGWFTLPTNWDFESLWEVIWPTYVSARTDARYQVLEKVRGMRFNAPVFFAEAQKSVDLIRDSATRLHRAYRAFRRGKFGEAAKALRINKPTKGAAQHWLAYQYGWKPIIADAVGAAISVYNYFERERKPVIRATAFSAVPLKKGKWVVNHQHVDNWKQEMSWERQMVARAGLLLEYDYTAAADAARLGVGLYDPLLVAWELTPFSFVFDWFVDVGGWLEARSSLQGFNVLTGWSSAKTDYSWSVTEVPFPPYHKQESLATWSGHWGEFYRELWMGDETHLSMPLYDAINGSRVTTLASLYRTALMTDRKPGQYKP